MSMQTFFLSASQAHEKIGCKKGESCKVVEFLDIIEKIINSEETYDKIRSMFIAQCLEHKNTFNCLSRLASPENSSAADEIGSIMKQLDSLRERKENLKLNLVIF